MTDLYLKYILLKYAPINGSGIVYTDLINPIRYWLSSYLLEMKTSGSVAKNTAIHGKSDVDFLISIHKNFPYTLENTYNDLYELIRRCPNVKNIKKQRVSIGFQYKGFDVDLVPAIKDLGNTNYHKLYVNEPNKKWILTNIHNNISYVIKYRRFDEIRLIKIWKKCLGLDFPSIYIEMIVIDTLLYYPYDNLSANFQTVLNCLANVNFLNKRFVDISNSNNIISDSIDYRDKLKISRAAQDSLRMFRLNLSWNGIIH